MTMPKGNIHVVLYVHIAKTFKNRLLFNHWPECIDIWYRASMGEEIQVCLNEVPRVMYGPAPGAKTFT